MNNRTSEGQEIRFPRATQSNAEWSRLDRTLFCVLAGVVSTFASGYTYGEVNQVEHLPQIFRALDAEYLTGDFFLNGCLCQSLLIRRAVTLGR